MKLRQYLAVNGISDAAFAKLVNCSRPFVTRLKNGLRVPSMAMQSRIAKETNGQVMPNDWIGEEPDRKARPRKAIPDPKRPLVAA